MTLRPYFILILAALLTAAWASQHAPIAAETSPIRIVSSSTVYPFLAAAAEHFGGQGRFHPPVIESLGSGGGLKLFCASADRTSPDLASSSRRITASERQRCAANGDINLPEIVIGYDGIVLANNRASQTFHLTRKQLFLALAKMVPSGGKLVANPYQRWDQIDPALPDQEIMLYGPAPNHGTRDILNALVMEAGCETLPEYSSLSGEKRAQLCQTLREDGRFIEVTQDYSTILQRLIGEKVALGVLPFSLLAQNRDRVHAASLENSLPSEDTIYAGDYVLARPLYLYVKQSHLG